MKYRQLATKEKLSYVIAVSEIDGSTSRMEVIDCLEGPDWGLFSRFPELSGVIFQHEGQDLIDKRLGRGQFRFEFPPNPRSSCPIQVPSGSLII